MGEVIDLKARRPGPAWAGWIQIEPDPETGEPMARLSGFSGRDSMDPPDRMRRWSRALHRLAYELDADAHHLTLTEDP